MCKNYIKALFSTLLLVCFFSIGSHSSAAGFYDLDDPEWWLYAPELRAIYKNPSDEDTVKYYYPVPALNKAREQYAADNSISVIRIDVASFQPSYGTLTLYSYSLRLHPKKEIQYGSGAFLGRDGSGLAFDRDSQWRSIFDQKEDEALYEYSLSLIKQSVE